MDSPKPAPAADRPRNANDQHRRAFFARLGEIRNETADGDERRTARIAAALDRIGADAVRDALRPQQRADGTPMKWSAVCCERANGEAAGSPGFNGWARLAATPVREIKAALGDSAPRRPPRQRDRRAGDGDRRDDVSRRDIDQYGSDGQLRSRITIPGLS